jgi:phage shock protein A
LLDHEVDLGKIENRLSSLDKGLERVAETTDETVAWRKVATDGFQEMNRRISSLEEWKATGEEVLQTAIEDVASSVGNRIGRLTRSFESLDEDLASAKSSAEDDRLRFSGQIDELERKIEELRREIDSLR